MSRADRESNEKGKRSSGGAEKESQMAIRAEKQLEVERQARGMAEWVTLY